jgi:hypothetical protein
MLSASPLAYAAPRPAQPLATHRRPGLLAQFTLDRLSRFDEPQDDFAIALAEPAHRMR